jgi:hypothetical protein
LYLFSTKQRLYLHLYLQIQEIFLLKEEPSWNEFLYTQSFSGHATGAKNVLSIMKSKQDEAIAAAKMNLSSNEEQATVPESQELSTDQENVQSHTQQLSKGQKDTLSNPQELSRGQDNTPSEHQELPSGSENTQSHPQVAIIPNALRRKHRVTVVPAEESSVLDIPTDTNTLRDIPLIEISVKPLSIDHPLFGTECVRWPLINWNDQHGFTGQNASGINRHLQKAKRRRDGKLSPEELQAQIIEAKAIAVEER